MTCDILLELCVLCEFVKFQMSALAERLNRHLKYLSIVFSQLPFFAGPLVVEDVYFVTKLVAI